MRAKNKKQAPITVITVNEAQNCGDASSHSTQSPTLATVNILKYHKIADVNLRTKTRLFAAKACSVPQD
jgi:hypothetical protein